MVAVRIYPSGCDRISKTSRYVTAIRDVGIKLDDRERQDHFGVLLLDEPNAQVHRLIQEKSRGRQTQILVVVIGRPLGKGEAWSLLESGAADVLVWGRDRESAEQVKARLERWTAVDALLASDLIRERMIGHSPTWRVKLRELVEAARFTTSPVLLMGESGTGKELAARLIHEA